MLPRKDLFSYVCVCPCVHSLAPEYDLNGRVIVPPKWGVYDFRADVVACALTAHWCITGGFQIRDVNTDRETFEWQVRDGRAHPHTHTHALATCSARQDLLAG